MIIETEKEKIVKMWIIFILSVIGVISIIIYVPLPTNDSIIPPPQLTKQEIEEQKQRALRRLILPDVENYVQQNLKNPDAAMFSNDSDNWTIKSLGKNTYNVSSFVSATNSFGATIKTYFTVKVQYIENNTKVRFLNLKFY